MKKFLNALACFFKVILILFLCFEIGYLGLAAMNSEIVNGFRINKGYYGVNPTWLADSDDTVIDDIYERMDVDGKFVTAYNIYRKACEKLMLVPAYGVRASCEVDVSAIGINLTCASNRTEQYMVAGTPALNANQKVYSSYVNTIYITQVSNPALEGILKSAVQFATRGYSDGTEDYVQKGSLSAMDGEDEVIEWNKNFEVEKPSAKRTYADDEIRDKCNFVVTKDTIVPESVVIEREYDAQAKGYLYHVSMDLDCTDESENGATYYEAKAIKDLLGSNMKSLVYSQLKIDMTLYSNGYLMTWDTVQEWTLNYSVAFLSAEGTALNKKCEVFSYQPDECKVVDFTK